MKKLAGKIIASVLIAAAAASAVSPAYADWETKNGKIFYQDEDGSYLKGWQTIDGKEYYFGKDGSLTVKSADIDGIRYKFGSDGVCQGKYTGWVRSKGKRFYYEDGVRIYGWVHTGEANVNGAWYYVDEEKGRLCGEQTIGGVKYNFSGNGKWNKIAANSDNGKSRYSVIDYMNNGRLDPKAYGGCFMLDEMVIVWSVDGKAEKIIGKKFPNVGGVIYKKAEYSKSEMEEIRDYLYSHLEIWTSSFIDEINNRLVIGATDEEMDGLLAYLDTLPNKDCVKIINETDVVFYDD